MAERIRHKGNPHPKRPINVRPYVVRAILTTKEAWVQRPQIDRMTELRRIFEQLCLEEILKVRGSEPTLDDF